MQVLHRLLLALLDEGWAPSHALAKVEEQARLIEPDGFDDLGELADRWVASQTSAELKPRLRQPDVRATLLTGRDPGTPVYLPDPATEIIVRKDATDDAVTINGTEFRPRGADRRVVLLDRDRLEAAFAESDAYAPPGRHTAKALRFGDYVDVNEPVAMVSMDDPADFRQGHKVRALSDRGFGVIPVAVPEDKAQAFRASLGAPASTQRAVRERAGELMVDARAWAEGIVGRGHSIERNYLRNADEAIRTAAREGQGIDHLRKVLRKNFGHAEGRARFVARDRMGSLNASITQHKHQRLGFQFYRWLSSDDSRVRPEHAALHGTIRAWSAPHPTEGHPGEAPNCRCVAVPVTVDEYNRERRANRAKAVAVSALGVGAAVVGMAVARRRFRAPTIPATKPAQVPRPRPEPIPLRPAARTRLTPGGMQATQELADVVRLPSGGRQVMRRSASARFKYAHQLTRRILEAERRKGIPKAKRSHYAVTFGAAEKAIRRSGSDRQLMERLARLAGDRGELQRLPQRVRVRGKARPVKRRKARRR